MALDLKDKRPAQERTNQNQDAEHRDVLKRRFKSHCLDDISSDEQVETYQKTRDM